VPRPSSPVHAKASTNCPYLTLESPHHQRQHWIDAHRAATRNSAEQCSVVLPGVLAERPPGADDYNLSQIVGYASPPNACALSLSRNPLVIEADLERRSFAPALRPTLTVVRPNRHHHGIDFKNPFTMSKREACSQYRCLATADLVSSSLENIGSGGAYRDRTDDLMLAKQPLSQLS
jgi:hypothetical protein